METIANDAARRFMIVPNGSKVVGGNVMDFEKIMHYCLGKQNQSSKVTEEGSVSLHVYTKQGFVSLFAI